VLPILSKRQWEEEFTASNSVELHARVFPDIR
jgi:hypothetical protein